MMKFTTACLLALGSANQALRSADDATATTEPVAQQSSNEYGYEAPQETYTAEPQTYEGVEPAYVRPAKVCVVCDEAAPCWNGVGCTAKIHTYATHYSAGYAQEYRPAQESAGQQTQDYRQLQAQQTYNAQPEGYAQEMTAPQVVHGGSCPCGTVDTSFYRVHNNVVLWIAFVLLFLPGLWFVHQGWQNLKEGAVTTDRWNKIRMFSGIINMVASLAYLTMALGHGFITKCNGRNFYYARYVDWAITTPLMIYDFVEISVGNSLVQKYLVLMDIFMIVAGLIGELVEGDEKWAFFGFSMLAFIPIMWFLWDMAKDVAGGENQKLFRNVVALTLISWMGYPIIWILASVHGSTSSCGQYAASYATQEGYRVLQEAAVGGSVTQAGVISAQGEAYAYTVLDVIAKTVVGWIIVCHKPTVEPPATI